MKSLRKSFNREHSSHFSHSSISTPIPAISKPATAVVPPKKVIRAQSNGRPQGPTELPFQKGDFFYVIREVNDGGSWYEVHNPLSGARGLVPRALFEEVGKNTTGTPRTFSTISTTSTLVTPSSAVSPKSRPRVYYAVVLHDFQAERTDELDARAGDAISVVAQSNREWFVAKPIGKLGRPGLIPVAFVEVRDPASNTPITDITSLLESGGLPNVDEWKKDMISYKANSIALGVLDDPSAARSPISPQSGQSPEIPFQAFPTADSGYHSPPRHNSPPAPTPPAPATAPAPLLPDGILLSAQVVSFHYEMEEYWFRVHAIFQPYEAAGTQALPPARQLVLFRAYNDFYDFQVELLNTFPREAGREPPHPRVLPYMPGPAENVNHEITASRQGELDEYLRRMCDLQQSAARYVLEDRVVRAFVTPKPGDIESQTDPRVEEIAALSGYGHASHGGADDRGLAGHMAGMRLRDSDGSHYADERLSSHGRSHSLAGSLHPGQGHSRGASTSSLREPSPLATHARSQLPAPDTVHRRSGSRSAAQSFYEQDRQSQYSVTSVGPPSGGRSRSGSVSAALNLSSPPISSTNSNTAFVKIKIFVADDLIAVRVHPRVSHDQLLEKVATRVGGSVSTLRCREGDDFVRLDTDEQLREWIEATEKHVLYAQ